MTQAVANNLNSLNEMLVQTKSALDKSVNVKDTVKTTVKDSLADKNFDRKTDFSKVYDKQINKQNKVDSENIETKEVSTLGDIKLNYTKSSKQSEDWAGFKETLTKITEEANVETSLDLTLARDINEIISQLKETLNETVETTEEVVETSEVVEEVLSEVLNEEVAFESESESETESETETEVDTEVEKTPIVTGIYEQVLAQVKTSDEVNVKEDVKTLAESFEENTTILENDSETIELLSKLPMDEKPESDSDSQLQLDEEMMKELKIESLSSETATPDEGSLMDKQSPQEQAFKAIFSAEVESFDTRIDKVLNTQNIQQPQAKPVEVNPSKILEQITKQLEGMQNTSKLNIVLNPESLGRVTVQLIKTGEGLSAQFTVSSQEVRDMLMKGMDGLKETLVAQGVGVDNVSVKVNDSQKSEYNADWTEREGSRGGNKEQGQQNKEEKQKGLFEKMMAQLDGLFEENGNV